MNNARTSCFGKALLALWMTAQLGIPSLGTASDGETASGSGNASRVLTRGEQRLIRIPGLKRFTLSGEAIQSVRPPGTAADTLLIRAIRPGSADLWAEIDAAASADSEEGDHAEAPIQLVRHFRVENATPSPLASALSRLEEVEITLGASGDVILGGTIVTLGEARRVAALTSGAPSAPAVRDETRLAPPLIQRLKHSADRWAQAHPALKATIESDSAGVIVTASLTHAHDRSRIERELRALLPKAELRLESMPDSAPTAYFKVYLLELQKNAFHSLGMGWPLAQEGALQVTTAKIFDKIALDVRLQALEGSGQARILSRPELAVRIPGEAELFSGGELPIKVTTRFNTSVTWKNFGLNLKLKTMTATAQTVRLDIGTEISHLDYTIAADDTPGLQANRLKTQVDATFGRPLLLSGMIQQSLREQSKGLPFLRSIPILGSLFGSEDFQNQRSELVIVLVPSREIPRAPTQRFADDRPRGIIPIPTAKPLDRGNETELRDSSQWPWNAFGETP